MDSLNLAKSKVTALNLACLVLVAACGSGGGQEGGSPDLSSLAIPQATLALESGSSRGRPTDSVEDQATSQALGSGGSWRNSTDSSDDQVTSQAMESGGSWGNSTESFEDQTLSQAPESKPESVSNPSPAPIAGSGKCVTSGGADFELFKGKLDSFVNNPSRWYSRASNAAPLSGPIPGLMTVADGYIRFPTLAGLVTAFRFTCDDHYARIAFDSAMEYIESGRQQTSDSYLDWYAGKYNPSGNGWNYDHYEWRAAAGIGMLLSALIEKGGPVATAKNKAVLAEFLKVHVWEKWQPYAIENGTANESNVNVSGIYEIARIGHFVIALDQYYGSSTSKYAQWLSDRGGALVSMLNTLTVNNAVANMRWLVSFQDGGSPMPGTSDTSHASSVPQFLVSAYESGYSWIPLSTIQALGKGLNTIIWDGSGGGFHSAVNGTGSINSPAYGANMGGWFALLPYAPEKSSEYINWAKNFGLNSLSLDHGPWISANLMRVAK